MGAEEVLARSRRLLDNAKRSQRAEELLQDLPQGHGSGLNADMVDNMHAAEILAKARAGGGGGGGGGSGSGDMKKETYDVDENGIVDNAEKLNGHTEAEVQDHAPKEHGDEAHSLAYALSSELADHESAATGVHGVGAGIVAKVADIATDANLSAAGQDAIAKRHNEAHSHTATVKTFLVLGVEGTLVVGINKTFELPVGCSLTISKVKVHVKTAPTGAAVIVDVNKGGTTIFTTQGNRPTIAIGATDADSGTPDVTGLVENDKLSVDVDQVGSTIAGADLTVEIVCSQGVAFKKKEKKYGVGRSNRV